jgi:hypothetical protein
LRVDRKMAAMREASRGVSRVLGKIQDDGSVPASRASASALAWRPTTA